MCWCDRAWPTDDEDDLQLGDRLHHYRDHLITATESARFYQLKRLKKYSRGRIKNLQTALWEPKLAVEMEMLGEKVLYSLSDASHGNNAFQKCTGKSIEKECFVCGIYIMPNQEHFSTGRNLFDWVVRVALLSFWDDDGFFFFTGRKVYPGGVAEK